MPVKDAKSTRERILEIALELFTTQGYDRTSLRDIAERLGTTKAALYYHFARKEDILVELHLKLHAIGDELLDRLDELPEGPARVEAWPELLDRFIVAVSEHRELVLLHQRNQSAIEALGADERHLAANEDIMGRFARLVSSPTIPLADRVRIVASLGAVVGALMAGDSLFADVPRDELTAQLRAAARALLSH